MIRAKVATFDIKFIKRGKDHQSIGDRQIMLQNFEKSKGENRLSKNKQDKG